MTFKEWMYSKGYSKEYGPWGAWWKDDVLVTGKELSDLLDEYKSIY